MWSREVALSLFVFRHCYPIANRSDAIAEDFERSPEQALPSAPFSHDISRNRELLAHRTSCTGHQLHDFVIVGFRNATLTCFLALPQHEDTIGDLEYLGQIVGDEDYCDVLPLQAHDQLPDLALLRYAQRCGRFIEYQQLGSPEYRPADRDRLALSAR